MANTIRYFNNALLTTGDVVRVDTTKVYDDGGELPECVILSDAALTARAVADGRTAWDNDDVYAMANCIVRPVNQTNIIANVEMPQ